jgi:hypothetical protein
VVLLPQSKPAPQSDNWLREAASAFGPGLFESTVDLCGVISGLLFIPTTIFDMVWGVRYLQDARGLDYVSAGDAIGNRSTRLDHRLSSAGVRLGSARPAPGSDHRQRRRLVCVPGVDSLRKRDVFPPYSVALVAGVASGAAMLPYTIIKEANPPRVSGTATGVINFLNFTFSALLGPVFARLLTTASGGADPRPSSITARVFSRCSTASRSRSFSHFS